MVTYLAWRLQSLRNRFRPADSGATLVEYALLVALIAVVCIVALGMLGTNASAKFSTVGSAIQYPPEPVERRHRRRSGCESVACRQCGAVIPVEPARRWHRSVLVDPVCGMCGPDSGPDSDESLAWMFSLYARDDKRPRVGRRVRRRRS